MFWILCSRVARPITKMARHTSAAEIVATFQVVSGCERLQGKGRASLPSAGKSLHGGTWLNGLELLRHGTSLGLDKMFLHLDDFITFEYYWQLSIFFLKTIIITKLLETSHEPCSGGVKERFPQALAWTMAIRDAVECT